MERGSHEELMAAGGVYYESWCLQANEDSSRSNHGGITSSEESDDESISPSDVWKLPATAS